jgi:endoglycosylceramidase
VANPCTANSEAMRARALLAAAIVAAAVAVAAPAHAARPAFTTSGLWVLDTQGRHLYPRGFDVSGAEYTPTDAPLPYGPGAFRAIRASGATVVRIPIAWALIEPSPGYFDPAALARAQQVVQWAGNAGLDVVLDMHQYLWSSCLGGLGMPRWAVPNCPDKPPSNPLQQEADIAVAANAFWTNSSLQAQFTQAWTAVARAVGRPSYLIGYDIFNEPYPGLTPMEVFEAHYLTAFYRTVGSALRRVNPDALLYVEPSILNGVVNGSSQFLGPIGLPGVVYEPHQYGVASENTDGIGGVGAIDLGGPTQFAYDLEVDRLVAARMGAALWLGEWGALNASNDNYQAYSYVNDDLAAQDALLVPSAYWSYDVLSPQNAGLGLAGAFRRAEPWAIAGTPLAIATGTAGSSLRYLSDGGRTLVSLPSGCGPSVSFTSGRAAVSVSGNWLTMKAEIVCT